MALAPGTRLGPYEIVAPLGAGGMGEVYQARDTRLGRAVAVKTLLSESATDAGRLARLEQEARAASALNHPGIVAVFDVGWHHVELNDDELNHDVFYVVSELVEGQTLRALLREGPLSPRKAAELGAQTAEALAAAHRAGILHRDIKPENIMVTGSASGHPGRAKILDFGLAKHTPATTPAEETRTIALTREGMILGTLGYMSPEQARGQELDPRSDLFSLGAVLHEMLSGSPAFERSTGVDTISAVLKEDPPDLPASIPSGLAQIVRRALEKDPVQRFQSASDLAFALRATGGSTVESQAVPAAPLSAAPSAHLSAHLSAHQATLAATPKPRPAIGLLASLLLPAILLAGAAGWFLHRPQAPPVYDITPLTTFSGMETAPALSPDGRQLAFNWAGEPPGIPGIYVKQIDGGSEPLRVSAAERYGGFPAWSPDGSRIAFLGFEADRTSIVVVPALGGQERRIASWRGGGGSGLSWSPDGNWIATLGGDFSIQRISVATGEIRKLAPAAAGWKYDSPVYSPDGRRLAFFRFRTGFSRQVFTVGLDSTGAAQGEAQRLGPEDWNSVGLQWFPDSSHVLISALLGARRQFFELDAGNGRVTRRLPLEFSQDTNIAPNDISLRGERLAVVSDTSRENAGRIVFDRAAGRWTPAPFYGSSRSDREVQVSTDGRYVVFVSTRSGYREIWRAKADGSGALQLTATRGLRAGSPRWSPDGQWVAFDGNQAANADIYLVGSEGGEVRRLTTDPSNETRPSFSSDGKWIYFGTDRGGPRQIWKIPAAGGPAIQVTQKGGSETFESPDGRWLYYTKNGYVGDGLFRMPVAGGPEEKVLEFAGAQSWALSGNSVYLGVRDGAQAARIVAHDIVNGSNREIFRFAPGEARFLFSTSISVSRDEAAIYHVGVAQESADILLVDHFR